MEYSTKDFISYLCIGKDREGKRFRKEYLNYIHANGINMWKGNMYGIKLNGKRVKLKSVVN